VSTHSSLGEERVGTLNDCLHYLFSIFAFLFILFSYCFIVTPFLHPDFEIESSKHTVITLWTSCRTFFGTAPFFLNCIIVYLSFFTRPLWLVLIFFFFSGLGAFMNLPFQQGPKKDNIGVHLARWAFKM